jgi:hypothetical protein
MGEMFERQWVLNLRRRPDRIQQFVNGLPAEWPWQSRPTRFNAADGKLLDPPDWWKQGRGAWGCYRSHLILLEKMLNEGVESYLVFEDDATFEEDFAVRCREFLAALPKDAEMIYLGGQHLFQATMPPLHVNAQVVRPYNINRTHAFGIRGRAMMLAVYQHLNSKDWRDRHHIDHHLGRLHMKRERAVYSPTKWLVGQRGDKSDVSGKTVPTRFWNERPVIAATAKPKIQTPFVAVLGLHRSGSSLVANILRALGVHMGSKFVGCEQDGGGEAQALAQLMERAMPFPGTAKRLSDKQVESQLRVFVNQKCREARARGTIAAGKYPHLCEYVRLLPGICGEQLKVIHCQRDLEDSVASLVRRCPKRDPAKLRDLQLHLMQQKLQFLTSHEHLNVDYDRMIDEPAVVVGEITQYLELELRESAIALVDPGKRHSISTSMTSGPTETIDHTSQLVETP